MGLERYLDSASVNELREAKRAMLARVIPEKARAALSERRIQVLRMSHEAKDQRRVYRDVYGLNFQAANPGKDGGAAMLNHYLKVDETMEHPFKPGVWGDSRLFLVVPDGKEKMPDAVKSDGLHGPDLARFQLRRWRYAAPRINDMGEVMRGPVKMHDDVGNGLMMLFYDRVLTSAPMSEEEEFEERLDPTLRSDYVEQLPLEEQNRAANSRAFWARHGLGGDALDGGRDGFRAASPLEDEPFYLDSENCIF